MADLRINLDRLESVHLRLTALVTELEGTDQFNHSVADATGNPPLALVVGEFANWWNLRRERLVDNLRYVSDSAQAIHDTFIELNQHLEDEARATMQTVGKP